MLITHFWQQVWRHLSALQAKFLKKVGEMVMVRLLVCEKFPVRHGTGAEHSGRKLVMKGFLSGMGQEWSIAAGNWW
jgi:hypothetical protein